MSTRKRMGIGNTDSASLSVGKPSSKENPLMNMVTSYNTNKHLATYDVFIDLLGKLTNLYGKPTSIEPQHDIYSKYEAYVWYGKNNTMVHLVFSKLDSWSSYDTVDLTYGFAKDYEDVNNIYTIFTTKKKNAEDQARDYELDKVQDDYDGL